MYNITHFFTLFNKGGVVGLLTVPLLSKEGFTTWAELLLMRVT